ncbi:MAG: hypothetical protein J6W54_13230 [Fibrobacter sp.]|nr:hypothetical protein [Fibrobacter sp.]MBO7105816.1 hypothetical protein [Fibrobacter sp.]
MCETKKLHELYEECKRMNFTDSSELVESAQSAEEADFFAKVCDIILQQKQDKVVETNRF